MSPESCTGDVLFDIDGTLIQTDRGLCDRPPVRG